MSTISSVSILGEISRLYLSEPQNGIRGEGMEGRYSMKVIALNFPSLREVDNTIDDNSGRNYIARNCHMNPPYTLAIWKQAVKKTN